MAIKWALADYFQLTNRRLKEFISSVLQLTGFSPSDTAVREAWCAADTFVKPFFQF